MKNTLKSTVTNKFTQQPVSQPVPQPQQHRQPQHTLQPQHIQMLESLIAQPASPLQYIADSMWCVVVKKRNVALELLNYPDFQKNDVYQILSFHTTHKGANIAYINLKIVNSDEWRIISKYIIKIPYNSVNFNIEFCPILAKTSFIDIH
jgi:hypothetical protein